MFEKELENIDYVRSHRFLLIQAIELAIGVIVVLLLLWFFVIRSPFIRRIYGTPDFDKLEISSLIDRQNLEKKTPIQSSVIRGINVDVQMIFKQKINVTATVLNIQKYGFWGTYTRGSRGNALYDKIAPFDVALACGVAANKDNLKLMEIKSDYRYFSAQVTGQWRGPFNADEFENYIIIPSNRKVEAALSLLKKGDIAEFEGYTTELKNVSTSPEKSNTQATNQGKVELKNGRNIIKKEATTLYLTKIRFNGYIFQ